MKKGLLIVNTGNGKGKTTAAFGMILRAVGHGMQSEVVQFIKQRPTGEITALEKAAPELVRIHQFGLGFTWDSDDLTKDAEKALEGWEYAKKVIKEGSAGLLVLDEFTYPIIYKMIPLDDVMETLRSKSESMHIVITGRDAPEEICQLADCVNKIESVKHHYEQKVPLQKGVEF